MPKKPVVATEEEVNQHVEDLKELIKKAQEEAAAATQATEDKWRAEIQRMDQKTDTNASSTSNALTAARSEAKEYTEECITQLNTQILSNFPPLEATVAGNHEDALKKLDDCDTKLQQLIVDELSALAAQFDEELQGLKAELTNNLENWGRETAEAMVDQRRQLDESIENLRTECMDDRTRIREETKLGFEQSEQRQHERDEAQDSVREEERREIYNQFDKVDDLIREKERAAAEHADQVATTAESNRASLAEQNHNRLVRLNGEARQLREGLREVENVTTRRVEWVVKKASEVIRAPPEGWSAEDNFKSFYSPKFNGAGAWGMQFELQLFGPPQRKEGEEPEPVTGTGNLGVCLWACKGTRIAFKLYIGERGVPLEKKFNGRAPASSGRLCWLRDQINKEDDTLRVGVEFLEAMREVEYTHRMPPPPLPLTGRSPDDIDSVMKAIDALEGEEEPELDHTVDGSLCFMRYLNNRVIDQVQQQVSGMESRMVRRIQWQVQHASKLRQYFSWGQAICSPCFGAAGVDKMQLALYPSGYGTAVTDGFCSLFLYAPAGCTMHCFLSVAKQVREIQHTWEQAGAYGRTNFCMFDHVIDLVDDTILVTLEIEDAQQDVCTAWAHQEAATRKSESHQAGGISDKDLSSITKLTKNAGKAPNGKPNGRQGKMDTVLDLPSFWTPKALVQEGQESADIPEGFHSFDEVLNRRPMKTRPDSSGNGAAPPAARVRKIDSAPSLHDHGVPGHGHEREQAGRTAMQEDLSPPLPPFSQGSVKLGAASEHYLEELPGGASSYGQARKAATRRQRPGSSGATTRFGATS